MARIIKAPAVQIDYDKKVRILTPLEEMLLKRESENNKKFEEFNPEDEAEIIIRDARFEIARMKSDAEKEAKGILQSAKKEADLYAAQILESAESQGYEDGYGKGEGEAQVLISNAEQFLADTKAECEMMISEIEPKVVQLITDICQKLVGDCVKVNESVVLHVVSECLRKSPKSEHLKIYVSSEDIDFMRDNEDRVRHVIGNSVNYEIAEDSGLEKGSCYIETGMGSITTSVDKQLEALLYDIHMAFKSSQEE